jgi:nitrite reductase (NO-forming)
MLISRPDAARTDGTRDTATDADARWSRRLAVGLPLVIILLIAIVANQTGTILIARDLRDDYAALAGDAESAVADAAAELRAAEAADAAAAAAPVAAPARPAVVEQVTVELSLTEFAIDASVAEVPPYAEVTFVVTNDGVMQHDAVIEGLGGSEMLDVGTTGEFTVEAPASGSMVLICTVPGHAAAGMQTTIAVTGAGDADPSTMDHGAASAPAVATADVATPDDADAYTGDRPPLELRDPTAPAPSTGTVHDLDLVIEERVMQVAEGVWQEVWTFGGTVPGPTLRVKVGDTVDVTLINPADATVDHSIDFHASQVAWNDEMRSIAPGEELVYSFTATHAGMWMYHCGTAPALHHIGNGMFGAVIVEPAEGLPPVDRELVFVQSEWYTGPQGEVGDLGKMAAGAPSPDHVVFNGTAGQYAAEPIQVEVGERIRAWVLNAGPNVDSSFHIVGTIFDAVMEEGVALDADSAWGSQAVDLAPAQGAYVEFTLPEDGLYPIVTHAFNFPGRGALGLLQAGDGGEAVAGGH